MHGWREPSPSFSNGSCVERPGGEHRQHDRRRDPGRWTVPAWKFGLRLINDRREDVNRGLLTDSTRSPTLR